MLKPQCPQYEIAKAKAEEMGFVFSDEFTWEYQDTEEDEDGKEREITGTATGVKITFPLGYPHPFYLLTDTADVDRAKRVYGLIAVYKNRHKERERQAILNKQVEDAMREIAERWKSRRGITGKEPPTERSA